MHACYCLYCGYMTGHSDRPGRKTVCSRVDCTHEHGREEAREVEAGLRPWRRPLSFWISFFGYKPMPDDEAAEVQARWDAEQTRIREYNRVHAGGVQ